MNTPEPTVIGIDHGVPGGDHTVVHVVPLEPAPLEPAPPVGPNTVKMLDEQSPISQAQLDAVMARMLPPAMELVAVNGKPLDTSDSINGRVEISMKSSRTVLPPNIDIHKKLMVNTNTCRGKVAKRAARAQLKGARKEQMRLLKEERRG